MKKILLFLLLLSSLSISAQQYEVSGTVVDKKTGTPIEGAVVTSLGVYKAETGYDGSFTLKSMVPLKSVKVTAPGMNYQKKRASNGMTIKMKPQTMWNAKPENWSSFIGLEYGIPKYNELSIGIMAGMVKKHGFYVKALFSPSQATDGELDYYHGHSSYNYYLDLYNQDRCLTGEYKYSVSSYGAGYVYNALAPLNVYIGGGYMIKKLALQTKEGKYVEPASYSWYSNDFNGMQDDSSYGEVGVMGIYKQFFVNAGCQLFFGDETSAHVNVGIGFVF